MIPSVALAALAASVSMHVSWNLAARRADPRSFFLWWALLGYLAAIGPWSLVALARGVAWSPRLAVLLAVTAAAETLYIVALATAYRRAPVPLVYPIVRSSPLLVAVWSTFLLHQPLAPAGWIGIGVSVAGVLALALTARGGEPGRAVPWALAAALGTSVYSTSNKLAVDALPDYTALLGWVTIALAVAWLGLSLQHRRETGRWVPAVRPPIVHWLAAGLLLGNAYGLVIHAMRYIPAAYAVAFTNAGIVLAGLIAMILFGEREHWRARLAAMAAICAGLALLAAG